MKHLFKYNKLTICGIIIGTIINHNKDDLLIWQCKKHNFFWTKCLINVGANINNTKYTKYKNPLSDTFNWPNNICTVHEITPLTIAIAQYDSSENGYAFIKMLLDEGADPSLADSKYNGITPMEYAVIYNKNNIINLLHTYGADMLSLEEKNKLLIIN